jgi:hypothetical protein
MRTPGPNRKCKQDVEVLQMNVSIASIELNRL